MPSRIAETAENALVRELMVWWRQYNAALFEDALRPPVLALEDTERQLGRWGAARTLALSRQMVAQQPWGVVLEVLKHEMVHQYCDEVLGVEDEGPHGPTFKALCARLGIDGRAVGTPVAPEDPARLRILRRIQRLLALADSPEQHEAQAAMNAAQKLMLKHNLEAAGGAHPLDYGVRWLGSPSQRLQAWQRILGGILAEHFFVRGVWVWSFDVARGARGRVLEISGTPSNLEIAAYVYDFRPDGGGWEHKAAHGIRHNRLRRRFLSGVMVGFHEKLQGQQANNREEGLVWTTPTRAVRPQPPHLLRRARANRIQTDGAAAWPTGRAADRPAQARQRPRRAPRSADQPSGRALSGRCAIFARSRGRFGPGPGPERP